MIDWKRSKQISMQSDYKKKGKFPLNKLEDVNYTHYSLQLNVYKHLIEKNTDYLIEYMALGVFHPDQAHYQVIPVKEMRDEVLGICQIRYEQVQRQKAKQQQQQ
jgi:hypothetical protein